jgi:DNA-directed RNA polymerase subunit RPC12/RpoP
MTTYECAKCGKELSWLPDHKRWYCYECKAYAGEKGVAAKAEEEKGTPCPDCGSRMDYVPQYQAWHCAKCGDYKGLKGPATTASCPQCGNPEMIYSYIYSKWYCARCGTYPDSAAVKKAAEARPARKREAKTLTVIDDLFLIYNDGRLVRHYTRRLKPLVDTDILSSMLVAVQEFVKDAFPSDDKEGNVEEIKLGELRIVVYKGKWISLAAIISGDDPEHLAPQMSRCIGDMEGAQAAVLEKWDGDLVIAKGLQKYVTALLAGDYAK